MVALFEVQFFEEMEFNSIVDAIADADVERALSKLIIPVDAVQQLPDRFHETDLNTKSLRTQRQSAS